MCKRKGEQLNNMGFSLVELIVVVLLMSVIMGMVVVFISFSRNTYQLVSKEAILQTESEVAKSFINELAVEAYKAGDFTVSGSSDKGIWFWAPSNEALGLSDRNQYYYFILLESANQVLRYCSVKVGDSKVAGFNPSAPDFDPTAFDYAKLFSASEGVGAYNDPYALLAEHVTDISYKKNNGLISVSLKLQVSDEIYNTTMNVSGRNLVD